MIKHILSDGTELDSIEGLIVPPSGQTEAVYRLVAMIILERQKQGCRALVEDSRTKSHWSNKAMKEQ